MVATYEDAGLIVQLMRWGSEMGLQLSLIHIYRPMLPRKDVAGSGEAEHRRPDLVLSVMRSLTVAYRSSTTRSTGSRSNLRVAWTSKSIP